MRSGVIFLVFSSVIVLTMAGNSELEVVQSNGKFTNNLYKILSKNEGNVFFSPISAHAVLSMSYLGSAGTTLQAYKTSLGLPDPDATAEGYQAISSKLNNVPNVTLLIANKVYVKEGVNLKENFKTAVVKKFNAEVESVNFGANVEAAKNINSWVEGKTNNKIKDLIKADSLNALTRLVLVNAIYFKGNWLHKFDKANTRTEPFYLNSKDKIDVQMMHINKKFLFKHDPELKAKIVELPYNNPDVSMVIILPDDKDGIKDLEAKLVNTDLTKITEGGWNSDVELALPKFKIETTIPLVEPLKEIGLGEIFDSTKADFSNMIQEKERLYVSQVIQKAFIEVNEEGAEAAAATGMAIRKRRALPPRVDFICDRPFVVFLPLKHTDGSSVVLFYGKYMPMSLPHHDEL